MNLNEIKTNLDHSDYQYWLKAIAALKDFDESVPVPLLNRKLHFSAFICCNGAWEVANAKFVCIVTGNDEVR